MRISRKGQPRSRGELRAWGRLAAWTAVALWALSSPARAQPADPAPNAADLAIQKGRSGVELYQRGEWEKALSLFREADALYHSPVLVLYAARSQRNLGNLMEANSLYQAVTKEAMGETAPTTWRQAQIDGAAELTALQAEIPRVTVVVEGRTRATRATIDGSAIPPGVPTEWNPGEHRIVVVDGERTLSKTVTLWRGEVQRVPFDLAVVKANPEPRPKPVLPLDGGGPRPFRTVGIALTAVGSASLVAGGIFGGLALDKASAASAGLPPSCTAERSCPSFEKPIIEASFQPAYAFASAADGLLIGGGVAAAAGILLLILDPDRKAAPPHAASPGIGALQFHF